jgi:single stranded DNA-binding protein
VNRVELVGGLTRDPAITALPSGAMLCQFTLAWNEPVWNSSVKGYVVKTHYLSVLAWNELAEYVVEAFRTGDQVYVLGVLTQDTVEKDGKKESKTRVRALVIRPVRKARGHGDPAKVQQETAPVGVEPPPF